MGRAKEYMLELAYERFSEKLGKGKFDPPPSAIKRKGKATQIEIIKRWFYERYCDPARETPYISEEGGYMFIWGGPFDPAEVIPERFDGIASEAAIQECIDDLHREVGDQWAPVEHFGVDDYDESYDIPDTPTETSLQRILTQLNKFEGLVRNIEPWQEDPIVSLTYAAAIGSLEAYLYEIASSLVKEHPDFIKNLVKSQALFKKQQIALHEIFHIYENLDKRVMGHFQSLVWHRWKEVELIFRVGANIETRLHSQLNSATLIRHDITHRGGKTRDGTQTVVTKSTVLELIELVRKIAADLDEKVSVELIKVRYKADEDPF